METTCPTSGTTQIKFFSVPEPPRLRRISFHLEEPTLTQIKEIAQHEELDFSSTMRELLAIGLSHYKFKRGTLNPEAPSNNNILYCQSCGEPTKVRHIHTINVINEQFKFCENCFFANKHKTFVIRMISRL